MALINLAGIGWLTLCKRALQAFGRDRMQTYAAALAFRAVFAMFPFLLFLIAIVGVLGVPEFFDWLRQQARLALPAAVMEWIGPIIEELQTRRSGVLVTGIGVALWTASLAVRDLIHAMNNAYEVEESRSAWKLAGICVGTTLTVAMMLLAAAGLMLLGPQVTQWLFDLFNIDERVAWIWRWLRWPVVVALLMLMLALLYYVTPNVRRRFRFVSPGSFIAVPVWILASIGFSLYARKAANYGAIYGGLGAIIILLLYFYISALVLLFGAEVNAATEHAAKHPYT